MRRRYLLASPVLLFISTLAQAQTSYTFSGKPTYDILAKQNNTVMGTIRVELYPLVAMKHTITFDSLVSFKFFDTTAFHRVVPNFVIQGGDPNSRHGPTSTWGFGDPSQPTVPAEFTNARHHRGTLAAARKANDINSATSQFYITVAPQYQLDKNYTIYGRVVSGMSVADAIVAVPRNMSNNMPLQKIEMFVTRVGSNDSVPAAPQLTSPPTGTTNLFLSDTVKLNWQPVGGAVLYEIQIATDPQFSNIFLETAPGTTSLIITNHQWMTTYYWRVRTNNGGKRSAYSETWNFTTEGDYTGIGGNAKNESFRWRELGDGRILVTGLHSGQLVRINDLSGRTVRVQEADDDRRLEIEGLPQGCYILFASEGAHIIKTEKVIIR